MKANVEKQSAAPGAKRAYSVSDCLRELTICRTTFYREVNAGRIRLSHVGQRRAVVFLEDFEAYIAARRGAAKVGEK